MRINKSLIAYTPTSGAGSGSVTSVALTAPTGFTVSGSPITTSGTLALSFTTGYGIPPLMTGNSGKFLTTNGTTMSWVNIAGSDVTGAALTEVDDTNVTMTLGGTPSTALLRSVSMTLGWAGQLAVSRGGTGANNLNGVVIGNSTGPMTAVNGGPLQILRVNAGATGYEFFTLSSISGSGTTNYIPKWTSSNVLGDSQIIDNGTNVGIGVSPSYKLDVAGNIGLNGGLAIGRTSDYTYFYDGTASFPLALGNSTQPYNAYNNNEHYFYNRGQTTLYATLNATGLGIGVAPTNKLSVNGNVNITGSILSGIWSGSVISVPYGGTGAATLTGVVIGNGTSAMTAITGGPNQLLRVNGSATGYEFFTSNFLTNPMTLNGDMIYQGGGVPVRLAANTTANNMFLRSVSSGNPSWETITGSDITGASLTKTDDTNVTLTLGGTPSTALLRSASLTLGWTGTLSVSRGGSGAATLSGVLIGNGTSAFTAITGGPNQLLRVNGSATGYEFFTASFLTNPMTLNYDMIYQSGGVPARLPSNITTTKQYLTSIGNGTATTSLAWASFTNADVPGDALTKVDDTNVTLTLGGTPATSVLRSVSLTMGWSGQLGVGRGGTGASTLTGVLIGNGTSAFTAFVGTAGQFLRRNTANTAYEFRTLQGGDIAGSELTFSNDTNVTMSLSGTPASALLQPVTIGLGWTGTLSVSRGGIGVGTITGVMIGNGTSAVTGVTGTANQILRRNAGNTAYEFWSANYLVNPMTLEGSLIYATTGGTPAELFANSTSTRKYLSQINGTAPTWEALSFPTGSGTTNYVAKWTGSTTLGNSLIFDNGSNIGIGDPSPLVLIDAYKATGGIIRVRSDDGGAFYVANSLKTSTIAAFGDAGGIIGGAANTTALMFAGNVPLVFYVNSSERARITTSGLFGIGTNSPAYKLDVNGVIGLAGTAFAEKSGNNNVLYDGSGAAAISLGGSTALVNSYDNTTHSFKNRGASVEFATITSSGLNVKAGHLQLPSANYITWGGAYGTNIPTISGTSGTGAFLQFYPSGSSSGVKMALRDTGQLALPGYTTSTSFTGTATASLAVTSAGDVITIAPVQTTASGTYTPTYTGLANVDSTTAYTCQYSRVGDTVTVSGYVMINATADNTPTRLSITLPVSSTTSSVNYANGTIAQVGGGAAGSIIGYGANTAEIGFSVLANTGDVYYSFIFAYRII